MIKWIIEHQRKSVLRSPSYGSNTAINVIMIILLVIMFLYVLAAGFVIDEIILRLLPGQNVVTVFNGFIIYYFLYDLLMRFYLQEIPAIEISHYLLLPIKKSRIIHFILTKSIFTFFNILPLFLTVPFAFKQILPAYGASGMLMWFLSIYLFVFFMSFLTVYLKKELSDKPIIPIILALAVLAISGLDYLNIFSLESISSVIFNNSGLTPVVTLSLALLLVAIYAFDFQFFKNRMHLESFSKQKAEKVYSGNELLFLSKFGKVGDLIALETKLMLRNKRPKSVLVLSAFFLLYGLIFYAQYTPAENMNMLVFIGIFITGGLMINYGQFSFSWESSYFDFLLTKHINIQEYITAKYYLFGAASLICFLLTIPYALFNSEILLINLAATAFNIGVNSIVMMYMVGKKPKRIDISKSSVMNYEGTGAAQFIMMIPLLVFPICINWLVSLVAGLWGGVAAIALIGVLAILFRDSIINLLIKRFIKNKYIISSSLRAN